MVILRPFLAKIEKVVKLCETLEYGLGIFKVHYFLGFIMLFEKIRKSLKKLPLIGLLFL